MYQRIVKLSKSNSFFLFGARSTGKSTLLKTLYKEDESTLWIDLLNIENEEKYGKNPSLLLHEVNALDDVPKRIIIDEVQKVPKILDIVHKLIFEKRIQFILTGSSARKLRRGQANLLAGRAFDFRLHPLTHRELGDDFTLEETLRWGQLPGLFHFNETQDKIRYLKSYTQTYMKEEIQVEQLVRNINPFRSFLEVAAQSSGEILNYARLAREARIDAKSVERYFQILEDTLLGFILPPYGRSVRKTQIQSPKFYFFDCGIQRSLAGRLDQTIKSGTYEYGKLFEHFIILEIIRLNDYLEADYRLSYLKTKDGVEIDLILERPDRFFLIEIKSSTQVTVDHTKALRVLGKDFKKAEKILISLEKISRKEDDIYIRPWREALDFIFSF